MRKIKKGILCIPVCVLLLFTSLSGALMNVLPVKAATQALPVDEIGIILWNLLMNAAIACGLDVSGIENDYAASEAVYKAWVSYVEDVFVADYVMSGAEDGSPFQVVLKDGSVISSDSFYDVTFLTMEWEGKTYYAGDMFAEETMWEMLRAQAITPGASPSPNFSEIKGVAVAASLIASMTAFFKAFLSESYGITGVSGLSVKPEEYVDTAIPYAPAFQTSAIGIKAPLSGFSYSQMTSTGEIWYTNNSSGYLYQALLSSSVSNLSAGMFTQTGGLSFYSYNTGSKTCSLQSQSITVYRYYVDRDGKPYGTPTVSYGKISDLSSVSGFTEIYLRCPLFPYGSHMLDFFRSGGTAATGMVNAAYYNGTSGDAWYEDLCDSAPSSLSALTSKPMAPEAINDAYAAAAGAVSVVHPVAQTEEYTSSVGAAVGEVVTTYPAVDVKPGTETFPVADAVDVPIALPVDIPIAIPGDIAITIPKADVADLTQELADEAALAQAVGGSQYKYDLTDVFPFCLPFDLIDLLKALSAEPVTPAFDFPFVVPSLGINYNLKIDLSWMDTVMEIVRALEVVAFILVLVSFTSKVIKW